MQFCLLCRNFSARSQKHVCSKSEECRANITILESDYSLKRSPRCIECLFANMQEALVRVPQIIFCSKNESEKKIRRKLTFFPNCSCWQVQCMFWQPCKKVLHKLRKIPLLFGKSRRHIDCSFENPDWKNAP